MTAVTIPPIPDVPSESDGQAAYDFAVALKTTIEVREGVIAGGTNSRFVTIQDLIDAGLIADGDIA